MNVGDLEGFTLGIIGYGRIGRRVARIAEAFDLNVLAFDPFADVPAGIRCGAVEELLRRSDFVTLHVPLTPENHNLINAERLALMPAGAILINCSRGGLVGRYLDDAHGALLTGHLAGLGLDVYDPEPPRTPPRLRPPECRPNTPPDGFHPAGHDPHRPRRRQGRRKHHGRPQPGGGGHIMTIHHPQPTTAAPACGELERTITHVR